MSKSGSRIWTIAKTEVVKYFRQPMVIAFAFIFPSFWTVMNAVMFGNEPSPMFGGVGTLDFMVPAFAFLVLLVTGLSSLPIELARNLETKAIKRYSFTPLKKMEYISGLIMGNFVSSLISLVILFTVAIAGYHIVVPGVVNIILFILTFFCMAIAVSSFGMFLSSVIKGFQSTLSVSLLTYFVFLFLAGCSVPLPVLPEIFQEIAQYLPYAHMVRLLQDIWLGQDTGTLTHIIVSLACLFVTFFATLYCFRWSDEK